MSDVTLDVRTEYWSWDNCSYRWDEANRSWNKAYDSFYTLNVSEELNVVDAKTSSYKSVRFDGFALSDKRLMRFVLLEYDRFNIGDHKKNAVKSFNGEGLGVSEGTRKFELSRIFNERFKPTSSFAKQTLYRRSPTESMKLAESHNKSFRFVERDNFLITDEITRNYIVACYQNLYVSESKKAFDLHRNLAETVGLSETYWDNISFFISSAESFTISEASSRKNVFDRTLDDFIVLSEQLARDMSFSLHDGFELKDKIINSSHYLRSSAELFGIAEDSYRKAGLFFNDIIDAGESFDQPKLAKGFYEKVSFTEAFSLKIGISHQELLSVVERFSKRVDYNRTPKESLPIDYAYNKDVAVSYFETVEHNDVLQNSFSQTLNDSFAVDDFECNSQQVNIRDNVKTTDLVAKTMLHQELQNVGIVDNTVNSVEFRKREEIDVKDFLSRDLVQELSDKLLVQELVGKNYDKFVDGEDFSITSKHNNQTMFERYLDDEISLDDHIKRNVKHILRDGFSTADVLSRQALYQRTAREKFTVAETYWDNILFYLSVLESCILQDEVFKSSNKSLKDKVKFVDLLSKHTKFTKWERPFGILEQFIKRAAFARALTEVLGAKDEKLGSVIQKCPREPLALHEALNKVILRGTDHEAFGIKDTANNSMHYIRDGEETVGISDNKLGSGIAKTSLENVLFKEMFGKLLKLPVREILTCDDELGRQVVFTAVIKEALAVIEAQDKSFGIVRGENFTAKDNIKKRLSKIYPENFVFMDALVREFIARRIVGESVIVDEYLAKGVSFLMGEEMNTYDALIKACDGILSNISVKEGELTLEEFLDVVDRPPKYTKFIEFKVGEYEYEDALVRVTLKTNVKQVQPIVSGAVMHVDIPDTDDRGEVVVTDTSAPTKVYFNKFYYNPPEVNVTLKAGNTSDGVLIPNIVSTEGKDEIGRYFEVELWNENWSERKTGRLSWVSKGY